MSKSCTISAIIPAAAVAFFADTDFIARVYRRIDLDSVARSPSTAPSHALAACSDQLALVWNLSCAERLATRSPSVSRDTRCRSHLFAPRHRSSPGHSGVLSQGASLGRAIESGLTRDPAAKTRCFRKRAVLRDVTMSRRERLSVPRYEPNGSLCATSPKGTWRAGHLHPVPENAFLPSEVRVFFRPVFFHSLPGGA